MYVRRAVVQKERLMGQAKRKCSVVSMDDLQMVQVAS